MRSWTGNLPWSAGIYDLCSALVLLQNRQVSISQVSTCKWCVRAQPWASDQVRRTESSSKSHQAITSFRYHFFTMMYILHFSKYKVIPQGISLAISQGFLDPSQTSYLKKKPETIIRKEWIPYSGIWDYPARPGAVVPAERHSHSPQQPASKTPVSRDTSTF